jgi:trehalose/maltose transport system permease protein
MRSRQRTHPLLWLAAALFLLFTLFPIYWAVVSSLESGSDLFRVDYWPQVPRWDNYTGVFAQQPFGRNLLNSFIVASLTVALSLALAVFAAYALGRVQFRGRMLLLYAILAVTMFPHVAVLSGMFELINWLGLYDTWFGLTLAYMLCTLPFTVWVMTSYMRDIPAEIEDAALSDGATPTQVVTLVLLPLVKPGLLTAALLAFVAAWNEFLFALTFTLTNNARTVPVAIALISGSSEYELPWGRIMAASVIVTVPLILLAIAFQRRIVAGLTAGAVKM